MEIEKTVSPGQFEQLDRFFLGARVQYAIKNRADE